MPRFGHRKHRGKPPLAEKPKAKRKRKAVAKPKADKSMKKAGTNTK